jgi:prepilin-type processing-associated H-X9-DG protein
MKLKTAIAKRDLIVALCCVFFLLANLGAIGGSGRRRAKEAVCLSNLRQLGTAFQMYTGDNEGFFQEGLGGRSADTHWWMATLKPYYKNKDLCLCPMAVRRGADVGLGELGATFYAWSAQYWLTPGTYGSYGINGWVEHRETEIPGLDWMAAHRWRTPNVAGAENVPLLLDCMWIDGWPRHNQEPPEYDDQPANQVSSMGRFCINRHNEHINTLFLDFSVSKIPLKCLWRLKWDRKFDLNYPLPTWPPWMMEFPECD